MSENTTEKKEQKSQIKSKKRVAERGEVFTKFSYLFIFGYFSTVLL